MQKPMACQEPDVTILAAVEKSRSRLLLENPPYHVGSDGESSMVVFLDVTILAAVEETRSRLLLENPRYHLGSDGESSMVVFLGTRR